MQSSPGSTAVGSAASPHSHVWRGSPRASPVPAPELRGLAARSWSTRRGALAATSDQPRAPPHSPPGRVTLNSRLFLDCHRGAGAGVGPRRGRLSGGQLPATGDRLGDPSHLALGDGGGPASRRGRGSRCVPSPARLRRRSLSLGKAPGRRSFRDQPPLPVAAGRGADLQEWPLAPPWAGGPLGSRRAPGVRAGVGGVRGTGAGSAKLERKGKSAGGGCPTHGGSPESRGRGDRKWAVGPGRAAGPRVSSGGRVSVGTMRKPRRW